MTLSVKAEPRTKIGKISSLRKSGYFPAVFYGKKEKSTPIQISTAEFSKIWKKAGESSVVSIQMPGAQVDALIHDVQFDPMTGNPVHADFYVFEKGHKLEISVPIEFVGESPAVKTGGVLVKVLHELKIKADPTNIPHVIDADVSVLENIGDHITASHLKLPAGVELMENPEEIIANVAEPKEEKEEESAPIDLSAIEVEKKGKAEIEDGAGDAEGEAPVEESK